MKTIVLLGICLLSDAIAVYLPANVLPPFDSRPSSLSGKLSNGLFLKIRTGIWDSHKNILGNFFLISHSSLLLGMVRLIEN
jgi:hypothetical protein